MPGGTREGPQAGDGAGAGRGLGSQARMVGGGMVDGVDACTWLTLVPPFWRLEQFTFQRPLPLSDAAAAAIFGFTRIAPAGSERSQPQSVQRNVPLRLRVKCWRA